MPLTDEHKIKEGNIYDRLVYLRVKEYREGDSCATVETADGNAWNLGVDLIKKQCNSHVPTKTEKVSRTEIVQKMLTEVRSGVVRVCYRKQTTADDVVGMLKGENTATMAPKSLKQLANKILSTAGEERVMTGNITGQDEFGRFKVHDFEKNDGRLVDPRTIRWLEFNEVRYEAK